MFPRVAARPAPASAYAHGAGQHRSRSLSAALNVAILPLAAPGRWSAVVVALILARAVHAARAGSHSPAVVHVPDPGLVRPRRRARADHDGRAAAFLRGALD